MNVGDQQTSDRGQSVDTLPHPYSQAVASDIEPGYKTCLFSSTKTLLLKTIGFYLNRAPKQNAGNKKKFDLRGSDGDIAQ